MSTVSHGFVFCAQQPEGCQGLRSGILQQLFVSPGKAIEYALGFSFFSTGIILSSYEHRLCLPKGHDSQLEKITSLSGTCVVS